MTVPTISDLPTPPSRADSPGTITTRSNALFAAMATYVSETNAQTAALDVLAADADAAVADALSGTNGAEWNALTAYTRGDKAWSTADNKTYRRKTNGTSATDPSADGTNWAVIVGTGDVKRTATQTVTNKTLASPTITGSMKGTPYAITDGASVDIDPANGAVQTWTLGANRTPTAGNFANGQRVRLRIADGASAYAVTWTIVDNWVDDLEPVLPTSGYGIIVLWMADDVLNGAFAGTVAS